MNDLLDVLQVHVDRLAQWFINQSVWLDEYRRTKAIEKLDNSPD